MDRPLRHMPALDGLRGLAVAGVVLFHAGHLTGGYLGVDLFFVLSGFLITSLLLAERHATGGVSLSAFWARRARRLLPALFGMLAGVAVYAAVWADRAELDRIRADALATLGYVANWRAIFSGNGYWDVFAAASPLEHTWSLAIEEQFYVVWPLAVLALLWLGRGSALAVLTGSLALGAASATWMIVSYTPGADPERVYLGTDTRGAAILAGAALAAAYSMWGAPVRRAGRVALEVGGMAGAIVLAWAWIALDGRDDRLYQGGFLACALAAVAVIAVAAAPHTGPLASTLSRRPLRALGAISYGLYLWHWPVYVVLTPERTGMSGWSLTAVRVSVSIAIAAVSYFLLELPIRRHGLPTMSTRVLAPAAATVAVLALVVTTAGGTGTRPAPTALADARTSATPPGASGPGSNAGSSVASDLGIDWGALAFAAAVHAQPLTSGPERVLIVGDSVAFTVGAAMEAHGAELGIVAWNRSVVDCNLNEAAVPVRFPDGTVHGSTRPCGATWATDVSRFQPEIVFLLLGAPGLTEIRLGDTWAGPCSATYDSWYHDRLVDAVGTLAASGARVVIGTAPVPMALGPVDETTRCLNLVHRQVTVELPNARVLDLGEYVCPDGQCLEEIDGIELRPDGVHFEGEGAVIVSRWLARQLTGAG